MKKFEYKIIVDGKEMSLEKFMEITGVPFNIIILSAQSGIKTELISGESVEFILNNDNKTNI